MVIKGVNQDVLHAVVVIKQNRIDLHRNQTEVVNITSHVSTKILRKWALFHSHSFYMLMACHPFLVTIFFYWAGLWFIFPITADLTPLVPWTSTEVFSTKEEYFATFRYITWHCSLTGKNYENNSSSENLIIRLCSSTLQCFALS